MWNDTPPILSHSIFVQTDPPDTPIESYAQYRKKNSQFGTTRDGMSILLEESYVLLFQFKFFFGSILPGDHDSEELLKHLLTCVQAFSPKPMGEFIC